MVLCKGLLKTGVNVALSRSRVAGKSMFKPVFQPGVMLCEEVLHLLNKVNMIALDVNLQ